MATVGLSFGSATSGAGFDVTSTVTSILAIQKAVEDPWNAQLTALKAQDTALSTIGTDLSTLTTSLQSLTDFSGVLAQKTGASSNTNVLTLSSADSTASAGVHSVTVSSLAQTSSEFSDRVTDASTLFTGTLSLQVGSGTAQTVTLDSGGETLAQVAATINLAGTGVAASVVNDGSGQRLSLVSGTSGAAGQLTVTDNVTNASSGSALNVSSGVTGADATLTVDGLSVTSSSNTVSTAIPGVTFQLIGVSSDPIQVQVANDTSSVASTISSFVTAYNAVITDLNTQEGKDSSGNAEPLYGSPTLALLQNQLLGGILGGSASGNVNSITQFGITMNNDGTLTLDTSGLTSELNANFKDAVGFFQNTGSFGQSLSTTLNGLSSTATTGAIYLAQSENSSAEKTLNDNISTVEARLATQKTALTTELNTANQILQAIPSQLNEVNEMYSAVTGYNETQQ
jgi:flagellar hook-associated protein 2